MNINSFIVYHSWFDNQFHSFTDNEIGMIITALNEHSRGQIPHNIESLEQERALYNAYLSCKKDMDANIEKYIHRCEVNKLNGIKGGRPSKNKSSFEREYTQDELEKIEQAKSK